MTAGDVEVVRGSLNTRKAVALDGTDDYVLADAHAVARVAAGDIVGTYSAWIYVDAIWAAGDILSAGDNNSATEYLRLFVNCDGRLRAILYHGGAIQWDVYTTSNCAAPPWYKYAFKIPLTV